MSHLRKITGASLAAAAAAILLAGCASQPAPQSAEVHCAGINACKGQGACKTASNACKGQAACKGQGWLPTASAEECTTKGGTVM